MLSQTFDLGKKCKECPEPISDQNVSGICRRCYYRNRARLKVAKRKAAGLRSDGKPWAPGGFGPKPQANAPFYHPAAPRERRRCQCGGELGPRNRTGQCRTCYARAKAREYHQEQRKESQEGPPRRRSPMLEVRTGPYVDPGVVLPRITGLTRPGIRGGFMGDYAALKRRKEEKKKMRERYGGRII